MTHISTQELAQYMGLIVTVELRDGTEFTGRVVAVDEVDAYFNRTSKGRVALADIKSVEEGLWPRSR